MGETWTDKFLVGLDLGQAHDYTAVTLMERVGLVQPFTYQLRFMRRFPLQMPYPDIFSALQRIVMVPELTPRPSLAPQGDARCTLLVDATGVGAPVVDILRVMVRKGMLPVKLLPVLIVGGASTTFDGVRWHVPKRDLATAVKILLDSKRLQISTKIKDHILLVKELESFRVKISTSAVDTYEAWREKDHDDLVLSTALCCWWAERKRKKMLEMEGDKGVRVEERRVDDVYTRYELYPSTREQARARQEGWTWGDVQKYGKI